MCSCHIAFRTQAATWREQLARMASEEQASREASAWARKLFTEQRAWKEGRSQSAPDLESQCADRTAAAYASPEAESALLRDDEIVVEQLTAMVASNAPSDLSA